MSQQPNRIPTDPRYPYPPQPNHGYPPGQYVSHPGYGAPIAQYPAAYPQQHYPQYPYVQNAYPHHAPYPGHAPHAGYVPTHYNPSYPNPGAPAVPSVPVAPTSTPAAPVTHVEQWCPSHGDNDQIDRWFKELDKESCSIIRGLEVARFLQRSNLSRDTLRTIWAVVDSDNKGYINRVQFNTIIRLVSISCYPVYMGAPPTMERYYATLRTNIPLPASLSIAPPPDPHAPAAVAVSAPVTTAVPAAHANVAHQPPATPFVAATEQEEEEQEEEEEEFSDFTAAVAPAAPVVTTAGSIKAPVSVVASASSHILDSTTVVSAPSIVPSGAQGASSSGYGDEDFLMMDDAAQAAVVTSGPAAVSAPGNKAGTAVNSEVRVEDDFDDDDDNDDSVGDFTSATAAATTTATATTETTAVTSTLKKQTSADMIASAFESFSADLQKDFHSKDDGDGDGGEKNNAEATKRPSLTKRPSATVAAPATTTIPTASLLSTATAGLQKVGDMSAFDELVERDLSQALAANDDGDWDDFADAPAPAVAAAVAVAPPSTTVELSIARTEVKAESSVAIEFEDSNDNGNDGDDDDDFGGFESSSPIPSALGASGHGDLNKATVDCAPSDTQPRASNTAVANEGAAEAEDEDEDFGDFGDFKSHSAKEGLVVDSHSSVTATATTTATVSVSVSVKTEPEPDLLDFLSEPVTVVTAGTLQANTHKSSLDDLAALNAAGDDLFNSPVVPAVNAGGSDKQSAASFDPFGDDSAHSPAQCDDFDPFSTSPNTSQKSGTTVSSPKALLAKPVPAPGSVSSVPLKPLSIAKPVQTTASASAPQSQQPPQQSQQQSASRKPLSLQELEMLSLTLSEKHLYEEAYACALQTSRLRALGDLLEQKRAAMESDELELAVQLKRDIARLGAQVEGQEEESRWIRAAQSSRVGDTIHETHDLVSAINSSLGAKFKAKFLASLPSSSAPLESRMEFHIVARRCARMIVAISSTHTAYPAHWLNLLRVLVAKMMQSREFVARFKALKPAEQQAVKAHPKMVDYIRAIVCLAELGLWVSASCEECFQNEREAKIVFNGCKEFLASAQQIWQVKSEFAGLSVAELSLMAAKVSEHSGVKYCDLSLRPVCMETASSASNNGEGDGAGESGSQTVVDIYPLYAEHKGRTYMKPALNLWLADVSPTLPASECSFA